MAHPTLTVSLVMLALAGCGDGRLVPQSNDGRLMELHPDYPVVEGEYQMTKNWLVDLPTRFNRRIDDGSLVIWRPGFTIWVEAYSNDNDRSNIDCLNEIRDDSSPERHSEMTEDDNGVLRFSYRLNEDGNDSGNAFYCFAVADVGHVMMAIYFDEADDINDALRIWRSISPENHAG